MPCSAIVRFKLDRLLDSLEFSEKQVVQATAEIRRFCQKDPEVSLCIDYLKSLPGIGWIVASQLMARIGDWRQIENIRQLPAFLGLVPSEHSTGDRTDRGSITRSGDPRLRSKLIQASWSAIRQDGELRILSFGGKKHPRPEASRVAIVAVAHKLSVRAAVVLMKQRPYEVREKVQSAPLTQEETGPRERLDDKQYQERKPPEGSMLETEIPGPSALRGAHRKSV